MVCTPRQVSADVSSAIDSVIIRALLQRPTRQGPPIQSPAAFADAIAGVAPPVPLPEPAPPAPAGYTERGYQDRGGYGGYPSNPNDPDTWQTQGPEGTAPYPERRQSAQFPSAGRGYQQAPYQGTERRGTSRALLTVVVVLVLAVIAATVWAVGLRKSQPLGQRAAQAAGTRRPLPPSHSATAAGLCSSRSATPRSTSTGARPATPRTRRPRSTPSTAARRPAGPPPYYLGSPKFGGLKPGTGLLINMGRKVKLSQVKLLFGPGSTTAEIYLGNSGPSLGEVEQCAVLLQAGLAAGDGTGSTAST